MADPRVQELQENAYFMVVQCFMQQAYNVNHAKHLSTLRNMLSISNEAASRILAEAKAVKAGLASAPHGHQSPQSFNVGAPGGLQPRRSVVPSSSLRGADLDGDPTDSPPSRPKKRISATSGKATNKKPKPPRASLTALSAGQPSHPAVEEGEDEGFGLMGRAVSRFWPRDGGWFEGVITDYVPEKGLHCITYSFSTDQESFEWYNVLTAHPGEFRLLDQRMDLQRARAQGTSKAAQQSSYLNNIAPSRGGKKGPKGRPRAPDPYYMS